MAYLSDSTDIYQGSLGIEIVHSQLMDELAKLAKAERKRRIKERIHSLRMKWLNNYIQKRHISRKLRKLEQRHNRAWQRLDNPRKPAKQFDCKSLGVIWV